MTRKFALAALLAGLSSPAFAQAWTTGGGDQGANWNVLSTRPVTTAPADTYEPTDGADAGFTATDWYSTVDQYTTTHDGKTFYHNSSDGERKIRITCEPNTAKQKDPIKGRGVATFGHFHVGSGQVAWDENTDYAAMRASPSSTCSGGPLNATNYLKPELLKVFSNGLVAGVREQDDAFYYVLGPQSTSAADVAFIRAGTAIIIGANPSDDHALGYNDDTRRAVYSAAGFEYPGSPDTPAGFGGWYCTLSGGSNATVTRTASRLKSGSGAGITDYARHLKAEDGSDPWGGTCTGTNAAPATLTFNLIAPGCWDGYNLTSPDGRGHYWYAARKPDNSVTQACPTTTGGVGYRYQPSLQVKEIFNTTGFADYGTWYFSSDRMNSFATAGDASSKDPCRQTTGWYCNGSTGHADWQYGWKRAIFDEAQRECLGLTVRGTGPTDGPAECNASQISRYKGLLYGTSPNSAMSGGCAVVLSCTNAVPGSTERYHPVVAGTSAAVTIHH